MARPPRRDAYPSPVSIGDEVPRLAAIAERGACTDAERRAAVQLRDELRARGRAARLEPAWVRPQWAWVWTAHCALGVVGSLVAVPAPAVGLGVLVATLASLAFDLTTRTSPVRALFPRRATQNVVSEGRSGATTRLVVTASVDAPRTGAIFRGLLAELHARARAALGGHLSSPGALLVALLAVLAAFAGARLAGAGGQGLGAGQLVPTIVLLVGCGALVDVALSPPAPGANADASAVAVALALVAALDGSPPRNLAVDLVLAGAGDGRQLGMRSYVQARMPSWRAEDVVVLALGGCGAGLPRFHVTEGLIVPLRLHPRLVELAGEVAHDEAHLRAAPTRRGLTGAYPARLRTWPAISVECHDATERVPRARRADDTPDAIDDAALRAALELCLGLVARVDREVG